MPLEMNYDRVREMRQAFQKGIDDLTTTKGQVAKIVSMLESGGLIGDGGKALSEALSSSLTKKITELSEKFEEMIGDLQAAEDGYRAADSKSASEQGK